MLSPMSHQAQGGNAELQSDLLRRILHRSSPEERLLIAYYEKILELGEQLDNPCKMFILKEEIRYCHGVNYTSRADPPQAAAWAKIWAAPWGGPY
jgi:hypothetical protein